MPQPRRPRSFSLSVEGLEGRDMPSAGSWMVEPFQHGTVNGLPVGWSQWADGPGGNVFSVDQAAAGLGDQGVLASSAGSATRGRAWLNGAYAADVEAAAAVYLNSAAPVQVLVRGTKLNTAAPSYYAVGVTRGLEVQLLKVVNGRSFTLGTVDSADYLSNKWVTIRIRAEGNTVRAFVHRGDTNQYLGADGGWHRQPVAAVEKTDNSIAAGGQVGVARPAGVAGTVPVDSVRVGPANADVSTPLREERFAGGASDALPGGWSSYVTPGAVSFERRTDETLVVHGNSAAAARAWMTQPVPTDSQVTTSVYVDGLAPAGVFARGSNVNGNAPTYYGATVQRGLEVDLTRTVNGKTSVLARLTADGWASGLWVQLSLVVKGDELRVQVFRSDTAQYLNADGSWGLTPTWAMTRADTGIRTGGLAGLTRGAGSAADVQFDNFIVNSVPATLTTPKNIPTEGDKPTTLPPPVEPPPVPPVSPPRVPPPPVSPPKSPPPVSPPATSPPVSPPKTPPPAVPPTTVPPVASPPVSAALPTVDRNYTHIRVANLAYYGTPIGPYEKGLLANSVDLVVPNLDYVDDIAKASPTTSQVVYTNLSNVYLGLLTDWLAYADRTGNDRESAFYHVSSAQVFFGNSASAVAVNHFWSVQKGSDAKGWTDVTQDVRRTNTSTAFASGAVGDSTAIGYTEKFREINFDLKSGASGGWTAQYEYVAAVDANGKPTKWSPLPTLTNTTNGLRQDGQVTFDPPKDWATATINGSARFYYVRLRTAAAGTPPVATTVLGRDYAKFNGTQGTLPAFDHAADANRDGYLSDAEYARRRTGFDARFVYESRLTFPYYGQNRYATNVSSPAFKAWAVDYHKRFLASEPHVTGFFVDNSTGRLPTDATKLVEAVGDYGVLYGKLLGAVNAAIGSNKWLLSNTAGGGTSVDEQIREGVSYLEEFALRPMAANHVQFEDLAALSKYRRQLSNGKGYEILDSLPRGGDPTSDRMMLATLAMYYEVADPNLSMLMINGGNEPSSGWNRHWTDAIRYNVGRPVAAESQFATGRDPANSSLVYKVYQRQYQNALVLYKPLSYTTGKSGTTDDNTATTHTLGGYYRPLKADGTLGAAVNKITLRNGEGAILVKV